MRTGEIKNETDEMKKWGKKIKRKDLKSGTSKYKYYFQQNGMIRSFGESIYACKINIHKQRWIKVIY